VVSVVVLTAAIHVHGDAVRSGVYPHVDGSQRRSIYRHRVSALRLQVRTTVHFTHSIRLSLSLSLSLSHPFVSPSGQMRRSPKAYSVSFPVTLLSFFLFSSIPMQYITLDGRYATVCLKVKKICSLRCLTGYLLLL